jgi:hypothetical protein
MTIPIGADRDLPRRRTSKTAGPFMGGVPLALARDRPGVWSTPCAGAHLAGTAPDLNGCEHPRAYAWARGLVGTPVIGEALMADRRRVRAMVSTKAAISAQSFSGCRRLNSPQFAHLKTRMGVNVPWGPVTGADCCVSSSPFTVTDGLAEPTGLALGHDDRRDG